MALFPSEPFFLISLVNFYLDSGRSDKALEKALAAISVNPSNAQMYGVAGLIYETSLKDFAKSEQYYLWAIELQPRDTELACMMFYSLIMRQKYNFFANKKNNLSKIIWYYADQNIYGA